MDKSKLKEIGARTKETPLIYSQKSELEHILDEVKKSSERTYFSSVENWDIKKQELNLG